MHQDNFLSRNILQHRSLPRYENPVNQNITNQLPPCINLLANYMDMSAKLSATFQWTGIMIGADYILVHYIVESEYAQFQPSRIL